MKVRIRPSLKSLLVDLAKVSTKRVWLRRWSCRKEPGVNVALFWCRNWLPKTGPFAQVLGVLLGWLRIPIWCRTHQRQEIRRAVWRSPKKRTVRDKTAQLRPRLLLGPLYQAGVPLLRLWYVVPRDLTKFFTQCRKVFRVGDVPEIHTAMFSLTLLLMSEREWIQSLI